MYQLTQNLKTGIMELSEVPVPALSYGKILVRNYYSMISAGTEGSKVSTARKGYLGKAKEKPEQVKMVLDTLKKEGIKSTYNRVMNKLDALNPLGYSAAGKVISVGKGVSSFQVGDLVATAGEGANHAEYGVVSEQLAVKIPQGVPVNHAAFTTVASIAMQGVRQADLRLGESALVIGLGLLGQITVQLLKAAGIRVVGLDIDPSTLELARQSGADLVFQRGDGQEENAIIDFCSGYGVDAAIITAATSSLDPVELAGKLCRRKGKVIIVGAVPTGFSRENYYKKELDLRMATSYGPGRYDANYEEKGLDYPIAYVRWTQNRNMQSFLQLVSDKKLDLDILTTHTFVFSDAPKAYQMIMARSEHFVGILLKYDVNKEIEKDVILSTHKSNPSDIRISFIGAGSFAQNSLLPNIKNAEMISVATTQGHTSKNIASKWNFKRATTDNESVVSEAESNTLFIATRHQNHGKLVIKGLQAGKNIFVEKPLCMNRAELDEIVSAYQKKQSQLMVGYNRRFAPHIAEIKKKLTQNRPVSINYRINAGAIPADHWIQDKEIGGGRIIGEVCHFLDLAMYLAGSKPVSLYAVQIPDALNLMDTLNISLQFKNGSIANISYYANGSKELKKEYLELFSNGVTFIVDDFKTLYIYSKSIKKNTLMNQDKGHKNELGLFLKAIKEGLPSPIPFDELILSSRMSFDVIDSIVQKKVIQYNY